MKVTLPSSSGSSGVNTDMNPVVTKEEASVSSMKRNAEIVAIRTKGMSETVSGGRRQRGKDPYLLGFDAMPIALVRANLYE